MKKSLLSLLILFSLIFSLEAIPPYYKLEVRTGDIHSMSEMMKEKLISSGYSVIGEYHPGGQEHLYTISFTSPALTKLASSVKDRGALAAVLKVGITFYDGKVTVSVINPEYLFYAYFRNEMENESLRSEATKLSMKVIDDLTFDTTTPVGFGGDLSPKDLKKYHYMIGMPYFDDPVELKTFNSFEEGVETIRKNLAGKKGNTVSVFEYMLEGQKVAVFGVGLLEAEKGESHFLTIIGEDHVAAMPYEIILQDNVASMLHGRFRFALHWPELKMGTFTKIMSSPGDVEDFMQLLVQ